MGFFYEQSAAAPKGRSHQKVIPIELMKEQGCTACSLDAHDKKRLTPKMTPSGDESPDVYILDGYPSESDDAKDNPLTGAEGRLLMKEVPDRLTFRAGYVVRCRPVGADKVGVAEVTCCSGHLEADIEASKPKVIIGMGPLALQWALGGPGQDSLWRGRMWPVKAGAHVCWYFHINHASFVLSRQEERKFDTEWLIAYRHDLARAFKAAKTTKPPVWHDIPKRLEGIELIEGTGELDAEALEFAFEVLRKKPVLGLDIETTGLRPYKTGRRILTCSISAGDYTVAFAVDHPRGWPERMVPWVKRKLLEFILESGEKIAHNLGFELEWLSDEFDPALMRRTEWGDSMAAAHTIDERKGGLKLGMVTLQCFGFDLKKMSNLDAGRLSSYMLKEVLRYNALDAKYCLLCYLYIRRNYLVHEESLWKRYLAKVELAPTLVKSQLIGLHADLDYAREWQVKLQGEIDDSMRMLKKSVEVQKFEDKFGRPFQVTDDDVLVLVRDIMRRSECQNDDGTFSVDEAALSSIPPEAGIAPAQILIHRGASKLKSTYVDPCLTTDEAKRIIHDDGLIHTNYNQYVAETVRLSSDTPNNQNWPKRKRKEVRGIIVAPDGCWLVAVDYGAGEARTLAMLSEDQVLVDALWTDFDIHKHWAERCVEYYPEIKQMIAVEFDIDWDEKGIKTLRQEMKNKWVFPQFFGASFRSCARNLHLPLDIAEDMQSELWDQFKGVKKWQQRVVKNWEKNLYVETLGGHRRHGPMSLNQLINTPVQGSLAEIVTDGMTRIAVKAEVEDKPHLHPPLNVHDDLTYHIPDALLEDSVIEIAHTMCDCRFPYINVPLVVEVSVSKRRWSDLDEVHKFRSDKLGYHRR